MDLLLQGVEMFLHIDKYLAEFFVQYGLLAYILLFVVIFAETGLVVTPFLPGDSLLFASGALAAVSGLNIYVLLVLIPTAAIMGNISNYYIGYWIGPKIFKRESGRFLNKANLTKAHEFYEKYGGMAITICRFFPILRTLTPFVAGVAKMSFIQYLFYNILGGLAWGLSFTLGGYFFGNVPFVKDNFSMVVVGIVLISFIPFTIAVIKNRKK
jgi:membrane-associated protein